MHYSFVGLMLKRRPGRKSLRTDSEVFTVAHDVSPYWKAPVCMGLVKLFEPYLMPYSSLFELRCRFGETKDSLLHPGKIG
jgi:hypothetical protein